MKKLKSVLLMIILSLSCLIAVPTLAAELPIIPASSKTKITIEKSEVPSIPEGTMKLATDYETLDIILSMKSNLIHEHIFMLKDEYGNRQTIDRAELTFSSSNSEIFTVDGVWLYPKKLGEAMLQVTYGDQQLQLPVHVIEHEIQFEFENLHDAYYPSSSTISFLQSDGSYHSYPFTAVVDPKLGTVQGSMISWDIEGDYQVMLAMGDHIYNFVINQNDKGKTIKVPYEASQFTKVTFDIPTTDWIEYVNFTYMENNVELNSTYLLSKKNTFYVMNGEYNIYYNASSPSNYYTSYIDSVNLRGGEREFTMPLEQFTKFQPILNFQKQATITTPIICKSQYIKGCLHLNTSQPIYAKQDEYSYVESQVKIEGYRYDFNLGKIKLETNNPPIVIDDELKSHIQFNSNVFKGGSTVMLGNSPNDANHLYVANRAGHTLVNILDASYKNLNGKLLFIRGNERYEVPVKPAYHSSYIELPNITGTFDVVYTFDENEFAVSKIRPNISGTWKEWLSTKSVANNHTWTVTLSSTPETKTVTEENVFIVDADGYLVEGVQMTSIDNKLLVAAPSMGYSPGNYTLYVRNAVKNREGNALSNTKMNFIVE